MTTCGHSPDSSRTLDVELVVEVLPVDAAFTHPDVGVGGVAYDPVKVRPVVPAGCDRPLSEGPAVELASSIYVSHLLKERRFWHP